MHLRVAVPVNDYNNNVYNQWFICAATCSDRLSSSKKSKLFDRFMLLQHVTVWCYDISHMFFL